MIFKVTREDKAVALTDCLFFAVNKDDLEKLMDQHSDMREFIVDQAKAKKELH